MRRKISTFSDLFYFLLHWLHLSFNYLWSHLRTSQPVEYLMQHLSLFDFIFLILFLLSLGEAYANGALTKVFSPLLILRDAYHALTWPFTLIGLSLGRGNNRGEFGESMPIVMVGDGYVPEHGTLYYNNNPHDIKYIGEMNELKGGNQAHWGWRTIFSQRAWKQGEQDDVVVDNVFLT